MTPIHTEAFLKKRKFYLAIPLLVLPFMTMAFWALGGGKDAGKSATLIPDRGIDMVLPSAQFKDTKAKDKMDIYQSAGKDTAITKDGVCKSFIQAMGFDPKTVAHADSAKATKTTIPVYGNNADQQSAKIEAKLAQLNRQISQPQRSSYASPAPDPEIKRLNKMMKTMKSSGDEDPEMKQLNNMLTKIQAIQNPELAKAPTQKKKESDSAFRAIPAVIEGKQKVMNGGTVRLKLTDSIKLKGVLLPKGQLLFGACQVTNQRLLLNIQNIRVGKDILPADLTVFSLDGMPGIPAPEAELTDAAGNGADNALSNMQFLSMDGSIGGQAAAGGINAAKGLFSKKVKKVKVKLQDNFAVLLRDNSRKK
ncbi:conjugative transposon protein TraM [Mucilaginibacter sp.]|uniref:conjugative transposon protein TraM n=1 Tax=Mucilaginibacter sp. TaxID=1882438 RepID=UPI0026188374|nr:conjugative transposon protein TraM [Mucilaginibacter sp.]